MSTTTTRFFNFFEPRLVSPSYAYIQPTTVASAYFNRLSATAPVLALNAFLAYYAASPKAEAVSYMNGKFARANGIALLDADGILSAALEAGSTFELASRALLSTLLDPPQDTKIVPCCEIDNRPHPTTRTFVKPAVVP